MKGLPGLCLMGVVFIYSFALNGCVVYQDYDEAMQRSSLALEQAELANKRVDALMDRMGK